MIAVIHRKKLIIIRIPFLNVSININEEMITTPKRKSVIVLAEKLFSSRKRSKSIEISNTPKADLHESPNNSKM